MNVYILLTEDRVRAYTTHARALKVYQRAQRMGVKGVEFTQCEARSGDPYKRAKLEPSPWSLTSCPCTP